MSDNMKDVLVPLSLGVVSYLITDSNIWAATITLVGTFAYFKYKANFSNDRSYTVDGGVNLSLDQTTSDPTKVNTKPSVMDYDTLGNY